MPSTAAARTTAVASLTALLLAAPLAAQSSRQFSVAVGPAVSVDGAPPAGGIHGHVGFTVWPGQRPFNLLIDAHATRLGGGTENGIADGIAYQARQDETQVGAGLSLLTTILPSHAVSPYLLAGVVYRHSWYETRLNPAPEVLALQAKDTRSEADLLLGGGLAIRHGSRRILVEARAYGGTAIHIPVTIGMTF